VSQSRQYISTHVHKQLTDLTYCDHRQQT